MIELLKELDLLVTNLKSDTTRSKLIELTEKLIELSKIYWEAKAEYTRRKNKYDNEIIMDIESFKWYFETIYENEYKAELETNPKAKKNKTSNVECETQAKLKNIWLKREMEEEQVKVVYLEPIIKSYYEYINAIKFIDRETIKQDNQIRSTDLPF